jgi:four helix bundle protein
MMKDPRCYRLIAQQVASADSICANIEEGYGRLSRREYVRFLDFSRGSARETRGRYDRMKYWLLADVVQHRIGLADEIIGILTKTINTLQRDLQNSSSPISYLKDEIEATEQGKEVFPPDPRPSTLPPA